MPYEQCRFSSITSMKGTVVVINMKRACSGHHAISPNFNFIFATANAGSNTD